MRRLRFALLLALATACSTATKPAIDTNGVGSPSSMSAPGSGADAGAPNCSFAAATSFTLPALVDAPTPAFSAFSNQLSCTVGASKVTYSLEDLNGDGQPDLVVTSACADSTVGVSVWLVYYNDGTGFASTPTRFALPPAIPPTGCAMGSIFDLDGDRYPDYVVTSLCNDATVGSSRWLVYAGSLTGFAQTSVPYALPPGYTAGAFATTAATSADCSGGKDIPAFSVFDLNGDGPSDFVITQSCSDASVGTTAWLAFFGTASGAAQTGTRFPVPTTPQVTTGAYAATSASETCSGSVVQPAYSLIDFNLDGKPDLVATEACSLADVGTSEWLYYENNGSQFAATPATIALPTLPGVPAGSFVTLAATGKCTNGAGAPSYTLVALAGTPRLDLLVTRDCADTPTGVSYWRVYSNAGSGFNGTADEMRLPAILGATTTDPAALSGALDCNAPASLPAYATTYLSGDTLGVVVTSACSDSTVGATRWLVYPASCQ